MEKYVNMTTFSGTNANFFQQRRQSKTLPYSCLKFDTLEIILPPPPSLLKAETTNECDFDEPDLGIGNTSGNQKNTKILL